MAELDNWPTTDDDSGSKTDGTVVNKDLFDAIKASVEDQVDSATNPTIKPKDITDEVVAARGTADTLTDRLDVALDADGSLKHEVVQRLTTSVASTGVVNGAETDLASYSLPAESLTATGQLIRITATGSFAANANTKTIRLKVDGVTILTAFNAAHNAGVWRIHYEIYRTGSTTGLMTMDAAYGTGPICPTSQNSLTATWTSTTALKITGQGTASNDILISAFMVELLN